MSQPEEKPITKEVSTEIAVNDSVIVKPEEPTKEEKDASGSKNAAPTAQAKAAKRKQQKPFKCECRDCKLYFGKGNPIECVNPNIVEMRYPKWRFANNSGTNKVPVFRRPADPDSRKDLLNVKRAKP